MNKKTGKEQAPTALELFAGAGGLAIGVHAAGFTHVGVVERDKNAAQTLKANSKSVLGVESELVQRTDARELDYGRWEGNADLLCAGPPCQPFSQGGKGRGAADERNMFPVFLDALSVVRPRAILIENVAGLMRERFAEYWEFVRLRLRYPLHRMKSHESWAEHLLRLRHARDGQFCEDERYEIVAQTLDAADYGIPQHRDRVIIVGFRADIGVSPFSLSPTHSCEALLRDQWVTGDYWRRHSIKPHENHLTPRLLKSLEVAHSELPLDAARPWRTVRDALTGLPAPVGRGCVPDFADHIQHPGARAYRGHSGSHYDRPGKALKAGDHGTPGGENTIIETDTRTLRYLTIREAARLQTFPDAWKFHGSWGSGIRQLGNAVPVDLGKAFAKEILRRLTAADGTGG